MPAYQAPLQQTIRLVVGLGNPGEAYARTRHNAGFWFTEDLAHALGASWQDERRFEARLARGSGTWQDVRLMQPMRFMNLSGQPVAAVARFFDITPSQILVVHDELDLAPGEIRLKWGGGHAGHNGLRSLHAALGTSDYWRLRIGIGHPRASANPARPVADWVLERPPREQLDAIEEALERALAIWPLLLRGEATQVMQHLHAPTHPNAS